MVLGIGIDIIEIDRVEKALARRKGLLRRLFTQQEIAYCNRRGRAAASLAARFAAKEAVRKACSSVMPDILFPWLEIEIAVEGERPQVKLLGSSAVEAEKRGIAELLVSLSHSRDYACASVVALGEAAGPNI
ncbi:MAG: holo-ACP synthase [Thermacetogeniaceae bacterium]|jgi:holo-[acyl-carrier protein] synthase|nr:holo-ACP synthase [Thermoanaerobacterales bacterium]NLN22331.1 holo-ACP synthase [Syntrophomonadaceae bacterium]